ncbi:MAG: hypothetical protein NT005_05795 [Spirochaetes bacterium]|nr:hypothetical protein [Spirochaetota bacterium]
MVAKGDYDALQVEGARSVMLELVRLLGEYRDDMVVVGGWVPALLIPQGTSPHVGSLDIDLALNHTTLQDPGYNTIRSLLVGRGYRQDNEQPYRFWRTVMVGGRSVDVAVDLLAGEYEGTSQGHRTQRIQDVRARKARGCELAFQYTAEVRIDGILPDGAKDSAMVRIAAIIPFLAMKGMAMAGRLKEKDPWDVYYCVKNFPGGPEALVDEAFGTSLRSLPRLTTLGRGRSPRSTRLPILRSGLSWSGTHTNECRMCFVGWASLRHRS